MESYAERRVKVARMCLIQRDRTLTMILLMATFPSFPPMAIKRSSGENATEYIYSGCWMRASWECVDVFQKVRTSSVEYAMNALYFGRAMHEQ